MFNVEPDVSMCPICKSELEEFTVNGSRVQDVWRCKKEAAHILALRFKNPVNDPKDPLEWINLTTNGRKHPVQYMKEEHRGDFNIRTGKGL